MASEFKIKNGLIVVGDVSTSGTITINGALAATQSWVSSQAYLTSSSLTSYATQSYVTSAIASLVDSAPGALDTLRELATALGNDASFSTTVTNSIASKQAQLNGTGFVKVSGTSVSYDNSTYLTSYTETDTLNSVTGRGASTANLITVGGATISNNLITTNGIADPGYVRITNPGGGISVGNSPTSAAIKIALPANGSFTNIMLSFTVHIYDYALGKTRTLKIAGYTYYNQDWYNMSVYQSGGELIGNINVRFGVEGGRNCVWIGETNTYWSYPNIFITDVQCGHSQTANLTSGWTISLVTTLGTVQNTIVAYTNITTKDIGGTTNYVSKFTGANTLGNSLIFDNGTNVGIGVSSPGYKLEVEGSIGVKRIGVAATSTLDMEGNFNFNANSGYSHVFKQAGSEVVRIQPSGNLGIGTASPTGKLDIVPSAQNAINISRAGGYASLYSSNDFVFETDSIFYFGVYTPRLFSVNGSFYTTAAGSVGIGTSSPSTKLEVRGNMLLKGDATDGGILTITRRYSTGAQTINFNNNHPGSNLDWTGARITSADAGNYNGYLDFAVSLGGNGSEAAGTAAVGSVMRLTKDGYVGIGTTAPATSLEVQGAANTSIQAIFQSSSSGNAAYNGGIQLGNAGSNQKSSIVHTSAGDNTLTFTSHYSGGSANKFIFAPGGTETVRFQQNGNVGIGTTDPTSQMSGTVGIGIYNALYPAVGFKNSTTAWLWYGQDSTFRMWNATFGDILTANTSGNIGIGTSSPSTKLDVNGVITATGGNSTNWNTAYSWGNHASTGYLTSETDTLASVTGRGATTSTNISVNNVKIGTDGTYGGGYSTIGFGGTTNGYNRVFGQVGTSDGLFLASATGHGIYFRPNGGSVDRVTINTGGNVAINTANFTYANGDNASVISGVVPTANKLFIDGSIQLLNNTDAIVIGRGASTFLTDEELGFGWGSGWYMIDASYLRVRNNIPVYSTGSFYGSVFYDVNDTSYYVDPNSTSNLNNLSVVGYQYIGGQTSNGQSNYQWDGATYRNPDQWTARLILRRDNATTGINGSIPSLVIFNNNGADQTTASMVFATNECVTGSNSVNLAGIIAKKESVGNCGGWSAGSLNFFVKNYGARVDSLALTSDGNATFSGIVYSTGYGNSSQWNTAYGWGNHASAGYLTSVSDIWVNTTGDTMTGTLSFAQPVGLGFANGQYIKDNSSGGLIISSGAAVNITGTSIAVTGAATFSSSLTVGSRLALQPSYFGYSSGYKTLLIGSAGTDYTTNAVSLAFNVDISGNPSGAFTGNGYEYIWRNTGAFITPNAANTTYNTLFTWNSSGQLTFPAALTVDTDILTRTKLQISNGRLFELIGSSTALNIYDASAGASRIYITSVGKVGIGTTAPAEEFHVLGRAIFDGGSGDSSTDAVVYVTKSNNNDWGLYINAAALDYAMYARVSPSAGYALTIHNGTTWTTRITGNAVIYLGEKNAIEGNYDTWLRLNNQNHYVSGVYTPGVMRADGGFNVSGSTVWHAGNDGSGSGLDADLLDGQNSTEFLRLLSGGAEASLDSYTDNGIRSVNFTGHSQHLLSWNAGGSTGTVQQLFHYGTSNNGWRIRNKTDNSSWSDWGYVVMATSNQGLISGTIATQSWVGSQSYATTSYVTTQINNLVNGAPGALDTLNELATALGNDASFSTTVTNSIAGKVSKAGDTMTGALTIQNGVSATWDYMTLAHLGAHARINLGNAENGFLIAHEGTTTATFATNGNLTITGALTESSSIKLKENVETSEGNLEKVVNLRPVTYNKIGSQTKELGLIAEEVAEVYPEFVQYDESGEPVGVNYSRLTAALIGAVKELTQRIEILENNG